MLAQQFFRKQNRDRLEVQAILRIFEQTSQLITRYQHGVAGMKRLGVISMAISEHTGKYMHQCMLRKYNLAAMVLLFFTRQEDPSLEFCSRILHTTQS